LALTDGLIPWYIQAGIKGNTRKGKLRVTVGRKAMGPDNRIARLPKVDEVLAELQRAFGHTSKFGIVFLYIVSTSYTAQYVV
jgi:hypothetical protein